MHNTNCCPLLRCEKAENKKACCYEIDLSRLSIHTVKREEYSPILHFNLYFSTFLLQLLLGAKIRSGQWTLLCNLA